MKNKSSTILIISIIILLLCASGYFVFLFSFNSIRDDLDGMYSQSANQKARLSELQKIENNLKITLADKDKLASLFVKQESIVDFIQGIEATMKKLHLSGSIDSVAEENPPELDGTDKEKLNISLSASGNFGDVVKFAGLVEKLPFKSTVDSMNLAYGASDVNIQATKGASQLVWKISINMSALADKPAAVVAPDSAAAPAPNADTTQ
jgi:Tfp pilus assembly protein PilO